MGGNYDLSEIGCESFNKDTLSVRDLKKKILERKFKIRANYASSDYETVGSVEISTTKKQGKWLSNLSRPVIGSDGKVKSRSNEWGGCGLVVDVVVACGKNNFS